MKVEKSQYINLANGSLPRADGAEVKFDLDSQEVQLSGWRRGWFWPRSRGILLQTDGPRPWRSRIDLTRLLKPILTVVSVLLAAVDVIRKYLSRGPEVNGGVNP